MLVQGVTVPPPVLLERLRHTERFWFAIIHTASCMLVAPPRLDFPHPPKSLLDFGEFLLLEQLLVEVLRFTRENRPNRFVPSFLICRCFEIGLGAFDFGDVDGPWVLAEDGVPEELPKISILL